MPWGHGYASLLLIPGKAKRKLDSKAHFGTVLSIFWIRQIPGNVS